MTPNRGCYMRSGRITLSIAVILTLAFMVTTAEARFLSVDPKGGQVGSSQSWNRYTYVQNNPVKLVDPNGEETQLAVGGHTQGNPFGHIAIVINGTVYSHASTYSGGSDWGVSEQAYFLNANNSRGLAQDDVRQTTLFELNISPGQEQQLEQHLISNDPNQQPYNELNHSCVTSTEGALETTGILPNNPGPVTMNQRGDLLQAGAPKAITPGGVVHQVQNQNLVTSTVARGNEPKVSRFRAFLQAIKDKFFE